MNAEEIDEFLDRTDAADENVMTLIGYEPSAAKVILYLSMTAALDCADAEDPDAAIETDIEILRNVAEVMKQYRDVREIDTFTFDEPIIDDEEWLEMFLDAQGFLDDVLNAHLEQFGGSTEEERNYSFEEATNSIIYMCASACTACSDIPKALTYCESSVRRTHTFIEEECTLVPKESIES